MEIERLYPQTDPDIPATGATWAAYFANLKDPTDKFLEFKNIVNKEIMDTIHSLKFDGFLWRAKPDLSIDNDFETKHKITKFYARVNYFRNNKKMVIKNDI